MVQKIKSLYYLLNQVKLPSFVSPQLAGQRAVLPWLFLAMIAWLKFYMDISNEILIVGLIWLVFLLLYVSETNARTDRRN